MPTPHEEITVMIEKLIVLNALPHDEIASWEKGFPDYHPVVRKFFAEMSMFWNDYDYVKNVENLTGDKIATYDLAQLKSIFTKLRRQERFCDGCWESSIKSGIFVAIQERLIQLSTK